MRILEIEVGDVARVAVGFTADELVVTLADGRSPGIRGCAMPADPHALISN